MLGDFRIDELAAQRCEAFECAFLAAPISREYPTTSVVHHIEQATCLAQSLVRLVEVFRGLGRHRSTPSRRISRISDVRS